MKQDLILVLRSIIESPRRALFAVFNIIFGVVVIALIDGYATSMFQGMRDGMIHSGLGHAQVFSKGLESRGKLQSVNITMSPEQTNATLQQLRSDPNVIVASPRLEASMMATNGDFSQVGKVVGIVPDQEAIISSSLRVITGRELFDDDKDGILLGTGLAEALSLKAGDEVTILGNTLDGILNAADLMIVGTVSTGNREADSRLMYVTLPRLRELMVTEDTTRIAVLLDQTDRLPGFIDRQMPRTKDGLELKTWRQLAPTYGEVVDLFSAIFLGVKIAVSVFVALAIGNTIAICVAERTREIGIARAIGDQKMEIARRFSFEGLALGLTGAAIGVAMAMVAATVLNGMDLTMPKPPGSSVDYPLRFILTPMNLAVAGFMVVVISFLATLAPALKAANIPVTEALRHV